MASLSSLASSGCAEPEESASSRGKQKKPKSPIPSKRKSSIQRAAKPAKAERLKSRLAGAKCQPPPSKERLNDMLLQSSSSSLQSSSSCSTSTSGFSSSRSQESLGVGAGVDVGCQAEQAESCKYSAPHGVAEEAGEWPALAANRGNRFAGSALELCRCPDCQLSGQQIYSWTRLARPRLLPGRTRPQTPPAAAAGASTSAARKAVSFRASVEQIGSPSLRSLNDRQTNELLRLRLSEQSSRVSDSCDSLHVTRDASELRDQAASEEREQEGDYLRPLDCSTPKGNRQRAAEQLVRVEVHKQDPSSAATDYTCLCSADFNCAHNYPHLGPLAGRAPALVSNELYGSRSDFGLASDCVECKNLSTYVNLSRPSGEMGAAELSAASSKASALAGGYASRHEYRKLLRSKQNDLYGGNQRWAAAAAAASEPGKRLDERLHYMSAARRLQETLDSCELCKRQLELQASDSMRCSCEQKLPERLAAGEESQQRLLGEGRSSASKPHQTGSSSLLAQHPAEGSRGLEQSGATSLALMNASELSVLPVNATRPSGASNLGGAQQSQWQQQQQSTGMNGNMDLNANVDSSLSSLFVYRHLSDDNQPADGFDPDSLDAIKPAEFCAGAKREIGGSRGATGSSWLKVRPRSEYISLSSTTSSVSAPKEAQHSQGSACSRGKQASAGGAKAPGSLLQVGGDLSQSSLAKRRHMNKCQQQEQQLQQSNGRKRPASGHKSSFRSSPLGASQSQSESQCNGDSNGHGRSSSSSGGANVRTIYQCFKNHLLDITSSSSLRASHSSCQSAGKQASASSAASTASLPRNLAASFHKGRFSRKSAQVCMQSNPS